MLGVFVNVATVLIGSAAGLLFKKGIPEKISKTVMLTMGLCTLYIGLTGVGGGDALVMVVSMVLGTVVGTLLNIDGAINRLGQFIENRMKGRGGKGNIVEGFMTASLLFCVGAMSIIGSLNSGLLGDHQIIFTKSIMDLISACMLASTLGIGVIFAAATVLVYQGALVLLAEYLQNVLTNPDLIANITCAGSIMIIALGMNIIGITKLKVADQLPAILFVPLVFKLIQLLPL
ncbi:MAG: DUF554 domain-containing protein [Oscillospiraceae bacterium]|nr:DUF554 domain-containing protein [Oscillospiraceae bacterium]